MIVPTPKPDEDSTKSRFRLPRVAALAVSACVAFGVVTVALFQALPAPHSRADYMIIGTVGTLAALITIFTGLVLGSRR